MNYHKIDFCNMNNGDGLRVVVWLSGCDHHCKGCFNPETWAADSGSLFGMAQIKKITDYLQEDWCSGITLTGGDPLFPANRDEILDLCKMLKKYYPNKTIWLYTGYLIEDLLKEEKTKQILDYIDVLCDGQFVEEQKSPDKHWVGSENQRVINLVEMRKDK